MTLTQWLEREGWGSRQRLHVAAEVSLPVIERACRGKANLASATRIHIATDRKVPISSMTADTVPEALEARPTRRARAPR